MVKIQFKSYFGLFYMQKYTKAGDINEKKIIKYNFVTDHSWCSSKTIQNIGLPHFIFQVSHKYNEMKTLGLEKLNVSVINDKIDVMYLNVCSHHCSLMLISKYQ